MLRVLPFVQQVRENRNRHDKGSLEEKFWKEIGNSLYGKLAQGLHAKTAFDTARGLNSPLPPSSVTQPFLLHMSRDLSARWWAS